jgi:guanylate kinase
VASIRERMEAQSTDKAKMDVSDFVIYNDACDNLFAQITKIHFELLTFVKK